MLQSRAIELDDIDVVACGFLGHASILSLSLYSKQGARGTSAKRRTCSWFGELSAQIVIAQFLGKSEVQRRASPGEGRAARYGDLCDRSLAGASAVGARPG